MASSMLEIQRDAVLQAVRDAGQGQWKILVVDEQSWKLILNVVKEDDILNEKIMNIEQIEQRRQKNSDTDAIYILTPESHIVDCVVADLERHRYRRVSLLWTSLLHASLRSRIDKSKNAQDHIAQLQVIDIGYYPRESNLVTFRDPWSFPILFHAGCDNLVSSHLGSLAQKIVSVCVSLGEYPTIRYYNPRSATHTARVLCLHLAKFVQEELDMYATYHQEFPPQTARPRGILYVLDRSIDLVSPLVHEFTYQAMVHDLLPIKEGDKVTYRMKSEDAPPGQPEKDVEITEKDKIWVSNRHRHMKDTIDKLMGEFQKFLDENPHFTNQEGQDSTNLNAIKDMMAGLPQFQEMKGAYSLHLTMSQECMNLFQSRKLPDLASVEQSLATGLDEDYKKPKNMADQVVRTLDEDAIIPPDRLRLLLLYLLYRDGLLPADTTKLIAHAQLHPHDSDIIRNLEQLGANTTRALKDPRPVAQPLFGRPQPPTNSQDDYALSRYDPSLKSLLYEHCRGSLDQNVFPYTKPQLDASENAMQDVSHASLRSAKPTWASTRATSSKPKQRVIVFMAGGATYSESRACYEISQERDKDVYLVTSHMVTPSLFVRQVSDLNSDPKRLGIPALAPPKQAPAHVFETEPPPQPPPKQAPPPSNPQPPTTQVSNLNLNQQNGTASSRPPPQTGSQTHNHVYSSHPGNPSDSKDSKDSKKKLRKIFSKH